MTAQQPDRIMVVDDDPDILNVARIALEAIGGFTIETCQSGQEAVNRVDAFAPDLILLDSMMPGMSGQETFKALARDAGRPSAPVVFFTGRTRREDIDRFKSLGAAGVVAKPFDPTTLAGTVRDIWARSCA